MGRIFRAVVFAAGLVAAALLFAANAGASGAGKAIAVHQTTSIADLFPGGPPGALRGNFDNPTGGPVFVHAVTATIAPFSAQRDPSTPPCTEADFVIAGAAPVGADVPPGTGVGSWSGLTVTMRRDGTDRANCEGVSITINYLSQ
jgi:hypothetical protein